MVCSMPNRKSSWNAEIYSACQAFRYLFGMYLRLECTRFEPADKQVSDECLAKTRRPSNIFFLKWRKQTPPRHRLSRLSLPAFAKDPTRFRRSHKLRCLLPFFVLINERYKLFWSLKEHDKKCIFHCKSSTQIRVALLFRCSLSLSIHEL